MLKHFFFKRLRFFSLIMCIPTVILLIVLGVVTNRTVQDNLVNQGKTSLIRIDDNVSKSLFNTLYQQNTMMSNAQYNLSLKKVLERRNMDFKDHIFTSALKTLLTNYVSSYPYIHSVYLYLDDGERFMTSSNSYLTSGRNYFDYDWIEIYKKMPQEIEEYLINRGIKEYGFEKEKDVMTIFNRMSFQKGVIVINIKMQAYEEMINSLLAFDEQIFCLVNSDGNVIYIGDDTLKENEQFKNEVLSELVHSYQDKESNEQEGKWVQINHKWYLLSTNCSKYFNAYQVSLIPFHTYFKIIVNSMSWILLVILLDIFIIILLSWITTKQSFQHISECIEVFSAAEKGELIEKVKQDTKDEYSLILNNVIYMYLKNNQMNMRLIEKQHQFQMAEIKALQLQINPHFIFNTLQTMDMEILKNEGFHATAHVMLQELASIIKYAFTNPMEAVTLKEELNYLSAYFRIQEIRFPKRIIWYYEIDEGISELRIFRLMLQPMIENCISHGLRGKEKILIKIKIHLKNNNLCFSIVDNGCGMSKEELQLLYQKLNDNNAKNVGLINVNRRLILNYGEESKLKIRSKENIATVISFMIPIDLLQMDEKMIPN